MIRTKNDTCKERLINEDRVYLNLNVLLYLNFGLDQKLCRESTPLRHTHLAFKVGKVLLQLMPYLVPSCRRAFFVERSSPIVKLFINFHL